jgi:hypothetical protein
MIRRYSFFSNEETPLGQDISWNTNMGMYTGTSAVYVPGFCSVLPAGSMTVELWANPTYAAKSAAFSSQLTDTTNRLTAYLPWDSQTVYWDHGEARGTGRMTAPYAGKLFNSWHHYAFVANKQARTMSVYVDGVLLSAKGTYSDYVPTGDDFLLGAGPRTTDRFEGSISEVRVWNYARTASETAKQMKLSIETPKTGLLACWRLSDPPGPVQDRSGNKRHGEVF